MGGGGVLFLSNAEIYIALSNELKFSVSERKLIHTKYGYFHVWTQASTLQCFPFQLIEI